MRKFFVLTLSFLILCTAFAEARRPKVGEKLPDFKGRTVNNRTIELSDYEGDVVLVVFWASWCGPCRAEVPKHKKLYSKYNSDGFEILAISLDTEKRSVTRFQSQMNVKWESIFDGGGWGSQLADEFGVRSIPQTYLLDQDGVVVGDDMNATAMDQKIATLLNVKGSTSARKTSSRKVISSTESRRNPMSSPSAKPSRRSSGSSGEIIIEFVDRKNAEEQTFETIFLDFQRSSPSARKEMGIELKKLAIEQPKDAMICAEQYLTSGYTLAEVSNDLAELLSAPEIEQDIAFSDTVAFAFYRGGHVDKAISLQAGNLKLVDERVKSIPEEERDTLVKQIVEDYGYMRMVTRMALYLAEVKQTDQAHQMMDRFKHNENLDTLKKMPEYQELQEALRNNA